MLITNDAWFTFNMQLTKFSSSHVSKPVFLCVVFKLNMYSAPQFCSATSYVLMHSFNF